MEHDITSGLNSDIHMRRTMEMIGAVKPDGIHIAHPFSKDTKELFDRHGIKSWQDVINKFKEIENKLDELLKELEAK